MLTTTINEANNFETWDSKIINELKESSLSDSLGNLLFENNAVKLWDITLHPNERMPFYRRNSIYSFNCLTDGVLLTRTGNGKIDLIRFEQGESHVCDSKNIAVIKDMQNVGDNVLKMMIVEHK